MGIQKRVNLLEKLCARQSEDGNWNHSPYTMGLTNGLIMALAVLRNEDPSGFYKVPPERFLIEDEIDKELKKEPEKKEPEKP